MLIYLYENGLEGLLTAYAAAITAEPGPDGFAPAEAWQPGLFDERLRIAPDRAAAAAFMRRLTGLLSADGVRRLLYALQSETAEIENAVFACIRLAFEHGPDIFAWQAQPAVRTVLDAAARVGGEIHRFHGLLRFRQMQDGSLYAPFAPDANIILPVAAYFRDRLGGEKWVIHDTRRHLVVFREAGHLKQAVLADSAATEPSYHRDEALYQTLWHTYFRAIAIPERINPELQRRCLPRRYWRYLIEKPQSSRVQIGKT